ncbi:MAG: retropepsin-like aspartic protease [Caldilineales bacterium]
MSAYDKEMFSPPAPVARVTLRDPGNHSSIPDVPMLIDSGADVTLIPQSYLDRLGLVPAEGQFYELMGFDGSASLASVVRLELLFLDRVFKGQFLVIDQEYGILGRNILNAVPLLLDGPSLTWSEFSRRS